MGRVIQVIQTVLPVIAVLGIGMLCRNRGKLTREGVNTLKSVAVDITLPAVLVHAFASANYNLRSVVIPLMMFVICIACWALGKLAQKVLGLPSRFVPYLTTGFEAGMLGYTLYAMLYGSNQTANFALVDLGQVLFVFTLYKVLLGMDSSGKLQRVSIVREMLTSPIIIAIVVGVVLGATGLYSALIPSGIAGIFDTCVKFIAGPTSVLILLSIGYDLVLKDVRWSETGKVIAARLAITIPLMGVMIGITSALFGYERPLMGAIMLMFILPPPFVLPVFADDPDQRTYVSSALSVSTLVTIVGFAILAAIGT
ncbi:hypothetical protein LJC33_00260 [Eubacteriales bacterium OttesenSCG-928-N13]|nr:hypothetical protein [Eubacteriales bacterium OttesenSCG-928-N13]